ncbi:MAG TPA: VWA domain-containing protein [Candidatus Acidoferrales bacterium]|nr:VWA domain-containing protein [Candidatus Acidoferrales bacterium]
MAAARQRYSRWDGSQAGELPDSSELFSRLAEDVFHGWDFESALRRLLSQGFKDREGRQLRGLEDLLERLREQRQEKLERYNLDGLFKNIEERLDRILQKERQTLQERLQEAPRTERPQLVEKLARSRRDQLDALPPEAGSAIRQLQDYQFLNQEAAADFQALLAELRQNLVERHFQDLGKAVQNMGAQDLGKLREMVADLNRMLARKLRGAPPQYEEFMEKWGSYFPDHPADLDSFLEQLRQQMAELNSLLESASPETRQQLQEIMRAALSDEGLQDQLAQLSQLLGQLSPPSQSGSRFGFFGGEELDLPGALDVMGELQQLDSLERGIRQAYSGLELPPELLEQLAESLGPDSAASLTQIQELVKELEAKGQLRRGGAGLELTPQGIRKIGQKALGDIFQHLSADGFGSHPQGSYGSGTEMGDHSKPYEFGDPFNLDVERTLMNAVRHSDGTRPLQLTVDDFEVVESERSVQTSTVLMLDMSRSMPLRGYFYAAKKMALALDSLIRTQYPRDTLYVVGFSDYAREIGPGMLAQLSYSEYVYGTNMQHGLMLARRLLHRHRAGNRQIIIVSDGEPTAHMEGTHAVFMYPPLPETFQKTLQEVRHCTQEGIVINTFMLESNQYLVQFVKQLTRQNRGRAFFVSPDRLGDYVLVDYVASRGRQS